MATKKTGGVKAPREVEKKTPEQVVEKEAAERPQYSELLIPKPKTRIVDSPTVANLQRQVDAELGKDHPSEEYIVEKISDIASQLYKETQAKKIIVAQIARKRASMMKPQGNFNCDYFSDLIGYIALSSSGKVRLHTKVGTEITEGENE